MPEAPEVLEETVTVEEDPGTPTSHVSIVTSEDGTTRRTETKVRFDVGRKRAAWVHSHPSRTGMGAGNWEPLVWTRTEASLALPRSLEPPSPYVTFLFIRLPRRSRL